MKFTRESFGCLVAHGRHDRDGYVFWGRSRAHIVAWTRARGEVPEGMELDHLCRNRACVALHHLELVDRRENERRKLQRYRLARQHCAAGHDLNRSRVITPTGGVVCRSCNLIAGARQLVVG